MVWGRESPDNTFWGAEGSEGWADVWGRASRQEEWSARTLEVGVCLACLWGGTIRVVGSEMLTKGRQPDGTDLAMAKSWGLEGPWCILEIFLFVCVCM